MGNNQCCCWVVIAQGLLQYLAVASPKLVLFLAANWMIRTPSFQKCSALENATQRNTCYDELRNELLKPPAK